MLFRSRVARQWGLVQGVPKKVNGLDKSLEESFDSLGSKGPAVKGTETVIVPSYVAEGAVSAEYYQYWNLVLSRLEDSCKQALPDMTIGQIKSTDRTIRASIGPKVKWPKSRFYRAQNRKVVIVINWETSLEVIKYDNGDKDTSRKKGGEGAGTAKNPNKINR